MPSGYTVKITVDLNLAVIGNVCGKNIPLRFKTSGKIYNFFEFENMNYIVLEYLGKIIGKSPNKNNGDKNNVSTSVGLPRNAVYLKS